MIGIVCYAALAYYILGMELTLWYWREAGKELTIARLVFLVTFGGCLGIAFYIAKYWNKPINWRNK